MSASPVLSLRVQSIRYEAEDIRSFELRTPDGGELPPFAAGAHLDLRLPGGLERSYSLLNSVDRRQRYRIAVQRSPTSRGGSAWLFDRVQVGDLVEVVSPANSFALHEDAALSVLIGGGIGITPLWSMIQRLESLGRAWLLYYSCRTRARASFLAELAELERMAPGRVHTVFDQEPGQSSLALGPLIAAQPEGAHLYCCGPPAMLQAFELASASRPPETVHTEYFSSGQAPAPGGFEVVLARQGETVFVPENKTILETLLGLGHDVPRSCMSGVCGTCETVVLEGTPDHRDHVLSTRERAANRKMMICCSGSLGRRLVLDL